jgi:hypothetical protein
MIGERLQSALRSSASAEELMGWQAGTNPYLLRLAKKEESPGNWIVTFLIKYIMENPRSKSYLSY